MSLRCHIDILDNKNMFDLIDHNACMKSNMFDAASDLCVCDNFGYQDVLMSSVRRNEGEAGGSSENVVAALSPSKGESATARPKVGMLSPMMSPRKRVREENVEEARASRFFDELD